MGLILILVIIPNPINPFYEKEIDINSNLKKCVETDFERVIELISIQGGVVEPENYFAYDGNKIEYACYTSEEYQTCVMQKPMLKKEIEKEILDYLGNKIQSCANSLVQEFERRGYNVNSGEMSTSIEIIPNNILINLKWPLTITKESSREYREIRVSFASRLYNLIYIANSILNWEARYGDSESTLYMSYYPNIEVKKKKQSEGTTIYLLEDRVTGDKFNFASRSLVWPVGLGLS